MNQIKIYILLLCVAGFCFSVFGQELSGQTSSFETIIESIVEGLDDEEADFSSILEDLEDLYKNPLNINSATESELKKLHLLNDFQITQLLDYREKSGTIISIFELNSLEGFNRDILEKIQPFILFAPVEKKIDVLPVKYADHQLFLRATRVLQQQKGFISEDGLPPAYEGSPEKIYARYKFQLGDKVTAGFTSKKDPGEAFFRKSNRNGFDYYSGHFNMKFNSILKNFTVGDFLVRSGQGLVLWQGFGSGKSTDVLNIQKNAQGISPYSSTDENRFFRGLATGFEYKNFNLSLFLSFKNKDANYENDSLERYFTSLQTSGYHRTKNEIADEKSISETSSGALFSFQKNRLKLGATFLYQKFNYPFVRENQPNNFFRFTGNENTNVGFNYSYVFGKYQFFGEAVVSKSGGKAILQGLVAHLHDQASFSFLFRHFDKNYQTLSGEAFSESSGNVNETGFYTGIQLLPVKHFKFSAYTDFYRFPWLTYTTMAPSQGFDFLTRIDYVPSEKIQMYIRYKNENKEVKISEGEKYVNTDLKTQNMRFHFEYNPSPIIQFRSRFEYSFYQKGENENGFMIYQDLLFMPEKLPMTAQMRIAWINTDSYNTRFYAYENDLLYNYSMPAYYGKSLRTYLNLKFRLTHKIDLWFKVSNTSYSGQKVIGSGYNEIKGQSLTEVKIQSRLRF